MGETGLKWVVIATAAVALAGRASPVVCAQATGPAAAIISSAASDKTETPARAHADPPEAAVDVIPEPAFVQLHAGVFVIDDGTRLSASGDPHESRIARYFAELMRTTRHVRLDLAGRTGVAGSANTIVFRIDGAVGSAAREAYTIEIRPTGALLSAADERGLLYAAVTLWQLCTSDMTRPAPIAVPAMRITDAPRFAWRGLLLDSARHYQSPQFILQLIDWMALHKLNVLQWHLTDDQAWRLEVRRYPRLTRTGAWRVPPGAGSVADLDPETRRPRLYGGFYSQRTVRQIVAHAAERNVTIVPEIDMPGHATAAIVAYPQLATSAPAPRTIPSDWGIYPNLYNVDEGTFEFLENVLREVIELFPGRYVDVGGDEAVKDQWKASARVQARMRELGISDERQLQACFVRRMGRFLNAHGRRLIGWDEILEGGIAPDATVMSWRGIEGALTAANAGHDTVLSPSPTLYLDHVQGDTPDDSPGRGGIVSLEEVYRFDPMPEALPDNRRRHVLGLQGNIWTEHIRTEKRVEYMTFPRAAAIAEVGWSPARKLSWEGFVARLPHQMSRYQALGIDASEDALAVSIEPQLERALGRVRLRLSNQAQIGDIHYTLDGSEPSAASSQYSGPLHLPVTGQIRAAAFEGDRALSRTMARSLERASLERRSSHELKSCTGRLLLSLEDDAPVGGPRAVFSVDIMNPCWIYEAADLSHAVGITASVGQVPFNFQLGADVNTIKLSAPQSADGELEVRLDGCDGERLAALPLAPAVANDAVTQLPAAPIGHHDGVHDLCFRFTQRSLDPMWVLDWVQLREPP